MTSVLSTFHAFLTLPNKTLKREKGTFFCSLRRSLQKRENGTFSAVKNVAIKRAVGSDVLISAKKEPLKINGVFKQYLKTMSNSTD